MLAEKKMVKSINHIFNETNTISLREISSIVLTKTNLDVSRQVQQ